MKKKYFFAAVALVALASCASDDFIGENNNSPNPETGNTNAIVFNSGASALTRGGDLVGVAAAEKLNYQFIVYGTKHASAEAIDANNDEVVFKNYTVEYTANTAGHTTSNTHNWEYVGKTPYDATQVSPAITGSQAIKYWDYSAANGYTFYGIASKNDITAGHVKVEKITSVSGGGKKVYDKGYTVTLDKDATLNNLYVADRKPVAKGDFGKPVTLTFRSFGARVRVGFYETIPGYSVKINKFYYDADASAAVASFTPMTDASTSHFTAAFQNISTTPMDGSNPTTNTLTLSYYDETVTATENHVKLSPSTVDYDYALTLGTGVVNTVLGESSAAPTWDNSGNYTPVLPFEGNTNPMLIKVDYTLTALDGSNETIEVKGATAVVPTQYVQWKSNFAYTYIFKISDNSNGKTGDENDPEGLFPITFDAIVVDVTDDKTQETITTFEDYSLTSYANGSKVTTNNEYKSGEEIYVVKTQKSDGAIVPQAIGNDAVNKAQVYVVTQATGADAISKASITAKLNGAPNGIVLTATTGTAAAVLAASAPAADGTTYDFGEDGAVKFTPEAAGTYAYVSVRTVNVPAEYTAVGDGTWSSSATYYFKTSENVYYAAEGINEANFSTYKASLFTRNDTPTPVYGVYDIKIIKVVE